MEQYYTRKSPSEVLHEDLCFLDLRAEHLRPDHGAERHLRAQLVCHSQGDGRLSWGEKDSNQMIIYDSQSTSIYELKFLILLMSEFQNIEPVPGGPAMRIALPAILFDRMRSTTMPAASLA